MDVILNLIRIAGDYVSEEVWYRVIQIVINREDVQGYAAKTVFEALQAPACHENMVKVAGYILGEFGNLIAGDQRSSPIIQFQLLHSKYHLCAVSTRALLLTTYVKFINLFPEIKNDIQNVLKQDSNIRSADAELQQRTVEYLQLTQVATADVLATVLEEMPPFPERESSILAILKKKKPGLDEGVKPMPTKGASSAAAAAFANETANNSAVLLDFNASPPPSGQASSAALLDIFGDAQPATNGTAAAPTGPGGVVVSNEEGCRRLVCKHNGVMFENDLLQIGIKAEYKQCLGRISVFYGNKTNFQFTCFLPNVTCPGELARSTSPPIVAHSCSNHISSLQNLICK